MSDNANEDRVYAQNWREYVRDMRTTYRAFAWAFREFVTDDSRKAMRVGIPALIAVTLAALSQPYILKQGFGSPSEAAERLMLITLFVFMVGEKGVHWLLDDKREVSQIMDEAQVDLRSTELFFEKSMAQHVQEEGYLNAASMKKGREHIVAMQVMMVYDGIPLLFELGFALTMLWWFVPFAGAAMTLLMAFYAAYTLFLNSSTMRDGADIEKAFRAFYRRLFERWENIERVKTTGMAEREHRELTRMLLSHSRDLLVHVRVMLHRFFIRGTVNALICFGAIWYGIVQRRNGTLSAEMLYPFLAWMGIVARNVWRVAQMEYRAQRAMPSVDAMRQALTMPAGVTDAPDAKVLPRGEMVCVELRDVGLEYAPGKPVLEGISLRIGIGQKVGLIAPSGTGKTSIGNLLLRNQDPTQGAILVNGTDLRNVRHDSWLANVAYIPQRPQILDGTLRYNLTFGLSDEERERITDEEIWRLLRDVGCDFGDRIGEKGLDTVVGKRGMRLSGGEQQRVMIVAAVLKRAVFMIIDEATSSLDSITEREVQEGLRRVLPPFTTAVIIAHRLSTLVGICNTYVELRSFSAAQKAGGGQIVAVAPTLEALCELSPTARACAQYQGIALPTAAE